MRILKEFGMRQAITLKSKRLAEFCFKLPDAKREEPN